MKIKNILLITGILSLVNLAQADNTTGMFKPSATLSSSCTISMSDLAFGVYNPNAGDSYSTAQIRTRCSKNVSYYIENDSQGLYIEQNNSKYAFPPSGTRWTRYMLDVSNNRLYYNIFVDSGYTMVFGGTNTFGNISGYAGKTQIYLTGSGVEQVSTVYGAMAGGQYTTPGSYSATLPVKVNF